MLSMNHKVSEADKLWFTEQRIRLHSRRALVVGSL